ncbi:uncharacterized protein LOC21410562 isoform X2 [Morus notabilis]|uniref:uncharacterized protein LOC21410562 isoform X2 n=1 Tax=Morus notabilis TaxID=981085 RepID=UPI000CED010C|nr:uncharacterized protein LOC21410562 isoform X2 [Morus notabilis]
MATLKLISLSLCPSFKRHFRDTNINPTPVSSISPPLQNTRSDSNPINLKSFSISYRFSASEDEAENCSFDEAVELFNRREYYKCHDLLEALWNKAEEPSRTLIHGILQCANHRGAMMELGEGVCKLRKMDFKSGPFHQFERDISAALDFIYQTQIELAACGDDLCVAMDQSERSYLLLGGYAAGQHLYKLQSDSDDQTMYIVFSPDGSYANGEPPRVKLPILNATTELLEACDYY